MGGISEGRYIKPIAGILKIYDLCKRNCGLCKDVNLCRRFYDSNIVPMGVGKPRTEKTRVHAMVGAAHIIVHNSPESYDPIASITGVIDGQYNKRKSNNWIRHPLHFIRGTPMTDIDSLKLALYQKTNCADCIFAAKEYIGTGRPCCNREECPLTDGKKCYSRHENGSGKETL
jgi:hypothetical protein